MTPEHERVRFAWWPVRLYEMYADEWKPNHKRWARKTWRIRWLKPVVETRTFFNGWVAYKDDQR